MRINSREFDVNYYESSLAYQQTIAHGGILVAGAKVRLHYLNGKILKVEVAASAAAVAAGFAASPPDPTPVQPARGRPRLRYKVLDESRNSPVEKSNTTQPLAFASAKSSGTGFPRPLTLT